MGNHVWQLGYEIEGRVVSIQQEGQLGGVINEYDGLGRCTKSIDNVSGVTREFVYAGSRLQLLGRVLGHIRPKKCPPSPREGG